MRPGRASFATLALASAVLIGQAGAAEIAILMPGSSGIVPGDFLVRNEASFKRAGLRTVLTTSPAGVVFVSGVYARVMAALGTPDRLPATLAVHHARDACKFTLPGATSEFVAWTRGKARLQ
ncbi:MAG: hypothetical protein IT536_01585 [Hyphomicrobiales bacterium]|nr:hypothetical protein [Hyphomicrobiales bacterium]